ncbi:MAG: ATP-binding protein, partial [Phycisphaerales bacterium]
AYRSARHARGGESIDASRAARCGFWSVIRAVRGLVRYADVMGDAATCLFTSLLATVARPPGEGTPPEAPAISAELLTEQLILVATIVGAIAALPPLIEFLVERRKRRERIELSLDDEPVSQLSVRLAGMDGVLRDLDDLIDRAANPAAYRGLNVGNEILIVGPALSGKKMLARAIAQRAGFDRLITVYNPRNPDALARAKARLRKERRKVMLLLPRIDDVFRSATEEVEAELDALIESTSERETVLVIGTATRLDPDDDVDNLFGVKIVLPGTTPSVRGPMPVADAMRPILRDVAAYYVQRACAAQGQGAMSATLGGMTLEEAVERVAASAGNPAEVEDIVQVALTTAVHERASSARANAAAAPLMLTPAMIDRAIARVVVRVERLPA